MSLNEQEINTDTETSSSPEDNFVNSIEAVRKCSNHDAIQNSWEKSYNVSFDKSKDRTPPFVSAMVVDSRVGIVSSSTQTEARRRSIVDVSLSFSKDFNLEESTLNDKKLREYSENSLGNKRYRRESIGDREIRPWKKSKCESCSSSASDITGLKFSRGPSTSSHLSSTSDTSFKSISSNHSFKVRKRRLKSDSNLFRDALQRSRKNTNLTHNHSETNTPGGSGTPRKDRNHRRVTRSNSWRIMDLCTWIGKKSYQSITGLYSDYLKEPIAQKTCYENPVVDEIKEMRNLLDEVNKKQQRMEKENQTLRDDLTKMIEKIGELENKIRIQESLLSLPRPPGIPPPPPPLPPPPLPSSTIPRCGPAPPRIAGPRLTITPQDIANVKLRKTKDNPVRSKIMKKDQQPLVTQQMLQSTRAKLSRARPVASSTPKQQLSELEKCLLQEISVTNLYRHRVARNSFRRAEELRMRPYSTTRVSRSPRSPRSNSLPRRTPLSPLKLPNGTENK